MHPPLTHCCLPVPDLPGMLEHQVVSVGRDAPGMSVPTGLPPVDAVVLPFGPGPLTFGSGMSMKMAVTRLQQWAFETVLMGDTVAGEPQQQPHHCMFLGLKHAWHGIGVVCN